MKKESKVQVMYLGRWFDQDSFKVFVYSFTEKRLARSWEKYQEMISSGLWFDEPPVADKPSKRKQSDGSANS